MMVETSRAVFDRIKLHGPEATSGGVASGAWKKDAIDSDWKSWRPAELEHRSLLKGKADPVSIAASWMIFPTDIQKPYAESAHRCHASV